MIRLVMLMLQFENENILSTNMQKNKQLFLKNTVAVSIEKKYFCRLARLGRPFVLYNFMQHVARDIIELFLVDSSV